MHDRDDAGPRRPHRASPRPDLREIVAPAKPGHDVDPQARGLAGTASEMAGKSAIEHVDVERRNGNRDSAKIAESRPKPTQVLIAWLDQKIDVS